MKCKQCNEEENDCHCDNESEFFGTHNFDPEQEEFMANDYDDFTEAHFHLYDLF